jgi:hypothetical protein
MTNRKKPTLAEEHNELQSSFRHVYTGGNDHWFSSPNTDEAKLLRITSMDASHLLNCIKMLEKDRSYMASEFEKKYSHPANKTEFLALVDQKVASMRAALAKMNSKNAPVSS